MRSDVEVPEEAGGCSNTIGNLLLYALLAFVGSSVLSQVDVDTSEDAGRQTEDSVAEPATAPSMSQAERDYVDMVEESNAIISESLDTLSQQLTAAGDNPSLVIDEQWQRKAALGIAGVEVWSQKVVDYEPVPTQFRTFHHRYVDMAMTLRFFSTALPLHLSYSPSRSRAISRSLPHPKP